MSRWNSGLDLQGLGVCPSPLVRVGLRPARRRWFSPVVSASLASSLLYLRRTQTCQDLDFLKPNFAASVLLEAAGRTSSGVGSCLQVAWNEDKLLVNGVQLQTAPCVGHRRLRREAACREGFMTTAATGPLHRMMLSRPPSSAPSRGRRSTPRWPRRSSPRRGNRNE